MKTPRYLLGAALLFWGWQTGLLWFGAAAALALESSYFIPARWEFSQSDLDRLWNLCVALFLGATIYAFFSGDNLTALSDVLRDNSPSSRLATINQSKRSLFQLLQWLPLMFLPMMLAQMFGRQDRFDLSTFSWWLRRQRAGPDYATRYAQGLNMCFPYFACCLFAASAANQQSVWFTAGLIGLVVWPLWVHRTRTFRPRAWITSLLLALSLGMALQLGMLEVQKLIQRLDEMLMARWSTGRILDAKENQTRLGTIGRLKLSGRILLRVDPQGHSPPPLLREASYNLFQSPLWVASKDKFDRLSSADASQTSWVLRSIHGPAHTTGIAGALPGGEGMLPLPNGAARLEQLPVLELTTNLFRNVRVEDGPGFVEFEASYANAAAKDDIHLPEDEDVPLQERAAVAQIAGQLHLDQLAPTEAVRSVEQFFAKNFTYSIWQGPRHRSMSNRTALARFLLENRSGHCEYFATATTLLLRAAHIPARYAIGYAVQEKSGGYYLVRERHAHAWCLAWINGAWHDIDTTPGAWAAAESQRASIWEPMRDLFWRVWFEFSRWRWGHAEWKSDFLWLIVPLLALMLGRVLWQRQWSRASGKTRARATAEWPGLDSEFYAIETRLSQAGLGRRPGETGSVWLQRLRETGGVPVEELQVLLNAHYRLRFDPLGLEPAQRLQLRRGAESWLSHWLTELK